MPEELRQRRWSKTFSFGEWFRGRLVKHRAKRIAAEIFPELWENSRRKLSSSSGSSPEFVEYTKVRAAQLAQLRIDELVKRNEITAETANMLIVAAAETATRMVIRAAGSARRAAA